MVLLDVQLMSEISELNEENASAAAANSVAEQQLTERRVYHRRCDEPVPDNLKPTPNSTQEQICEYWRWLLQREKDCVRMRQDYVDKWNDTYQGHRDQITERNKRIKDLEGKIKHLCQPCPSQ